MKKILKIGLISGPILFVGFLYFFGKNHYNIPIYYPTGVDSTSVDGHQWAYDTTYHTVPDFAFTSSTGETVTEKNFEGYIYVTDYFFTTCPSICPKMSNKMAYLQHVLQNFEDIKFLSHTVNPEYDTPEILAEYAERHEAKEGVWYFVTGDKKELYKQAREGYKLAAGEGDGGEDDFIHSQKFVLVDKERRIRGYYDGTDDEEIDRLIDEIRMLSYSYE